MKKRVLFVLLALTLATTSLCACNVEEKESRVVGDLCDLFN